MVLFLEKMGEKWHEKTKDCVELKKHAMALKFYGVKRISILWEANKVMWIGKRCHKWAVFGRVMEINLLGVQNTAVFAIFNTISSKTPRWKCFKKLIRANSTKEEENAIHGSAIKERDSLIRKSLYIMIIKQMDR